MVISSETTIPMEDVKQNVEIVDSNKQNSQVNSNNQNEPKKESKLLYGINDAPPWYLSIPLAFQHYLTMIGAIVSIPFILTPALCMADEDPNRGVIISTMIFVTGIVTYFQATWGCRLPIVQGGTISFLVPTLAILNLPQWKCPPEEEISKMNDDEKLELWQIRMRELSGAIAVSSLFQVFIGYTGLVGKILKFVTPLTIVPTVSLVGLTLFEHAAETASKHWGIAAGTTAMLTLFSQVLVNVSVPTITYRKNQGLVVTRFQLFKLFPVLLTIAIMWSLCGILTLTNVFEEGHPSRTDIRLRVLTDASWFYIPYPGQFGLPTVTLAGVLGMLAGVLACTVESISYYPTVSQMSEAGSPPLHAINRGIATEGLGTMLAGLWGSGNGTNTFGENVGAIGVTKVGSRRVIQWAAFIMILQGVIGKFGAIFIMIPDSVVGGIFCVMFGMIIAFGLSTLQYVDLRSSRNLYILGLSIFFPMVLCKWMQNHPGVIKTGNDTVDATLSVLLGTTILVGGFLGCFLDNIIPGTDEERGLVEWSKEMDLGDGDVVEKPSSDYDFPMGMDLLKKWDWTYHVPFLPTYRLKKES
ncbi:solute carrier family 23 member 1 isoform X2 [Condylostylus longicornis]|uniref:solute carrier family 23 member 1 isoform X2 n=1 Tax=Condylostylus longicornis TaxID=2530218 RepID=UPI00244DE816|nr:solute carrier family 23 member 1 isoform X2 [Condylostylus longicornis]